MREPAQMMPGINVSSLPCPSRWSSILLLACSLVACAATPPDSSRDAQFLSRREANILRKLQAEAEVPVEVYVEANGGCPDETSLVLAAILILLVGFSLGIAICLCFLGRLKAYVTPSTTMRPEIFVELAQKSQEPLDLVCCVDSSHSVGHENFERSIDFLRHLVSKLEMPTSEVGVLSFHHYFKEVSRLTGEKAELLRQLDNLEYEPGETKLGPPLDKALSMFKKDSSRKKVVLVVTDGDPNDAIEAEKAANALKGSGVLLFFIQVGDEVNFKAMCSLATSDKFVLALDNYQKLPEASTAVLKQVLQVSRFIRRAKCDLDVEVYPYQVVEDIDDVQGLELMIPGWQAESPTKWHWNARMDHVLQDPAIVSWDPEAEPPMAEQVPLPSSTQPTQPVRVAPEEVTPATAEEVLMPLSSILEQIKTEAKELRAWEQAGLSGFEESSPEQAGDKRRKSVAVGADEPQEPQPQPLGTQPHPQGQQAQPQGQQEQPQVQPALQPQPQPLGAQPHPQGQQAQPRGQQEQPQVQAPLQPQPQPLGTQPQRQDGQKPAACLKIGLEAYRQTPLDLVVCLDSSASFSLTRKCQSSSALADQTGIWVESGTFRRAKRLVELLAATVQMPEVRLGLVRFEADKEVMCELTGTLDVFLPQLRGTGASHGETQVAPPLREALKMHGQGREVQKAVLVITDGDPNDGFAAEEASKALKADGIQLLFVRMLTGRSSRGCSQLQAMAGPRRPGLQNKLESQAKGVLEVEDSDQALDKLLPELLQELLLVSQRVTCARCILPPEGYEAISNAPKGSWLQWLLNVQVASASDLDTDDGLEFAPPNSEVNNLQPFMHKDTLAWVPKMMPSEFPAALTTLPVKSQVPTVPHSPKSSAGPLTLAQPMPQDTWQTAESPPPRKNDDTQAEVAFESEDLLRTAQESLDKFKFQVHRAKVLDEKTSPGRERSASRSAQKARDDGLTLV